MRTVQIMGETQTIKFNDTATEIDLQVLNEGKLINLDGTSKAEIRVKNTDCYLRSIEAKIVDPVKDVISFNSGQISDLAPGGYMLEIVQKNADGTQYVYPDSGFVTLTITQDATNATAGVVTTLTLQELLDQLEAWKKKYESELDGVKANIQKELDGLKVSEKTMIDDFNTARDGLQDKLTEIQKMVDQVDKINNLLNYDFDIEPEADITSGTADSGIEDFASKLDQTKFNLAVVTDSHYQDFVPAPGQFVDYPLAQGGLERLNNFLKVATKTDFAVANGDNTNGFYNNLEVSKGDLSLFADALMLNSDQRNIALIAGNHDDGSPKAYQTPANVLKESDIKKIYHTSDLRFGEVRDGDSLYFYKDFADKKIRVIALWSEDTPETVLDGNGAQQYPRWLWHGFRQKQLDWLSNVALKIPNDYQALVITHAPIVGSGYKNSDSNAHFINNDLAEGILNAFIQGTSFVQSSDDSKVGTGWGAKVSADFSKQGVRKLIGFFNGHTHKEEIDTMTHFKQVHLLNDVTLKSDDVGTVKAGAITVISVDTDKQQVQLHGWGRATDRNFSY